ncbi:unnamed protein product [Merluccius merluccius]
MAASKVAGWWHITHYDMAGGSPPRKQSTQGLEPAAVSLRWQAEEGPFKVPVGCVGSGRQSVRRDEHIAGEQREQAHSPLPLGPPTCLHVPGGPHIKVKFSGRGDFPSGGSCPLSHDLAHCRTRSWRTALLSM